MNGKAIGWKGDLLHKDLIWAYHQEDKGEPKQDKTKVRVLITVTKLYSQTKKIRILQN
jgi:hypothetical protein